MRWLALILSILLFLPFYDYAAAQELKSSPAAAAPAATPPPAPALTLKELISEALKVNPDISASRYKAEAARAKIPQAYSPKDPEVGVMFDMIGEGRRFNLGEAEQRYTIRQMLDNPLKVYAMGEMAKNMSGASQELIRDRERDIIAKVKKAYFDYYLVNKALAINHENHTLLELMSRTAEIKYATGKATQQDVLKAQVELSMLANELIVLNKEKESARAMLNALLNRHPEAPLGEPGDLSLSSPSFSFTELKDKTLKTRPELQAMEYEVRKVKAGLTLAWGQYVPDLTLAGTRIQNIGGMNSKENGWAAEVMLTFPLYFASKQNYMVKEARANVEAAQSTYQSMRNMALFQVKDALNKVEASQQTVDLYATSIVPQAEQTLKAAIIGYETGKVDFLTMIEAQRSLRNARLSYYKALADYESRLADLERAVGTDLSN